MKVSPMRKSSYFDPNLGRIVHEEEEAAPAPPPAPKPVSDSDAGGKKAKKK